MASIFSKIVAGEIPAHKVAEDDRFLAFLDINPLAPGHTLVIPKEEIDYVFDLDDQTYMDFHLFAKRVARGLEQAVPCQRIGTAVVGVEVPHAHIHLIPLNSMDDMNFSRPKMEPSDEELKQTAEKVREKVAL